MKHYTAIFMRELPMIWEVTGRSSNHKLARNNQIKEAQSWRKKGKTKDKSSEVSYKNSLELLGDEC